MDRQTARQTNNQTHQQHHTQTKQNYHSKQTLTEGGFEIQSGKSM